MVAAAIAAVVVWPTLVEVGRVAAVVVRLVLIASLVTALATAVIAIAVCVHRRQRASVAQTRANTRVAASRLSAAGGTAALGELLADVVVIPLDADAGLYLLAPRHVAQGVAQPLSGHHVQTSLAALPVTSRRTVGGVR